MPEFRYRCSALHRSRVSPTAARSLRARYVSPSSVSMCRGLVGSDEAALAQGTERLIDPAQGDAAHQSLELLTGTQGPSGQQVENVFLCGGSAAPRGLM